jgi:hypothetical protein
MNGRFFQINIFQYFLNRLWMGLFHLLAVFSPFGKIQLQDKHQGRFKDI